MTEYFRVRWRHEGWMPFATAIGDPQQDLELAYVNKIPSWEPLRFAVESHDLVDYLPNNLEIRLCSLRMRQVIDRNLASKDSVQWLSAEVVDGLGNSHNYFVLHLPGRADSLEKLNMVRAKRVRRNLFRVPGARLLLFVSFELREALINEGCTGLSFEPVSQK